MPKTTNYKTWTLAEVMRDDGKTYAEITEKTGISQASLYRRFGTPKANLDSLKGVK
jgi:uncharacterized protein YerC